MSDTRLKLEQHLMGLEEQLRWLKAEYGNDLHKMKDTSGRHLAGELLSALVMGYSALLRLENLE